MYLMVFDSVIFSFVCIILMAQKTYISFWNNEGFASWLS